MPREKRLLIDVSAKIHRKFKIEAAKSGKTMSKILCAYMEEYVKANNPGDDVKKKIDDSEGDVKAMEELAEDILEARKIRKERKAQEDLKKLEKEPVDESLEVPTVENMDEIRYTKNPEKEPVDESLEVHTVEKPDEIRATKKPGKEPVDESLEVHVVEKPDEIRTVKNPEEEPEEEPEKEPVDESLEVHTVEKPDEIRTPKNPEKEPDEAMAAELENPGLEENPGPEENPGDEEYEFSNPDACFPFNLLRRKKQKKEKKQ